MIKLSTHRDHFIFPINDATCYFDVTNLRENYFDSQCKGINNDMKGSCNCETVRFEVLVNNNGLYQCHCKLCQKQSGSTSNTATIVREENFRWLSGENSITHWQKDSGFTAHFCHQCGCPVPNRLRGSEFFWVPMGLVDDEALVIEAHLCCSSKASWDNIVDDAEKYEEMPANIEHFITKLQA